MLDLVPTLQRMDAINRDIREEISRGEQLPPRLLELRGDFNIECGQLLQALTGPQAALEQARLLSRLQNDFLAMHQMLAAHQRRWSLAEIARDPDGYTASTQATHSHVLGFVQEALEAIITANRRPSARDAA